MTAPAKRKKTTLFGMSPKQRQSIAAADAAEAAAVARRHIASNSGTQCQIATRCAMVSASEAATRYAMVSAGEAARKVCIPA